MSKYPRLENSGSGFKVSQHPHSGNLGPQLRVTKYTRMRNSGPALKVSQYPHSRNSKLGYKVGYTIILVQIVEQDLKYRRILVKKFLDQVLKCPSILVQKKSGL